MAHKLSKKYALDIKGVLEIDEDGRIIIEVEDRGEFDFATMVRDFCGRECSISVKYDEDYESSCVEVDTETGEVFE